MTPRQVPVAIALGSNVGDSLGHLQSAVRELRRTIDVEAVSAAYRTSPMYVSDQPDFLNAALIGRTELGPRQLLTRLKELECEIGRHETVRYGPREIDLDLIAYGSLAYRFEGGEKPLVVPHPKTTERRFVLKPLCDVAPGLKLIGLGLVAHLLEQTNDQRDDVQRVENAEL